MRPDGLLVTPRPACSTEEQRLRCHAHRSSLRIGRSCSLAVPSVRRKEARVSAGPVRTSGGAAAVKAPVLLLYGEEYANLALADELALDGYKVRRASDPVTLRAACDTREIDVLILGQAARRGCGLEVLRQLRAGALAPQAEPGLRALWMSPNGKLRRRAARLRGRRR